MGPDYMQGTRFQMGTPQKQLGTPPRPTNTIITPQQYSVPRPVVGTINAQGKQLGQNRFRLIRQQRQ